MRIPNNLYRPIIIITLVLLTGLSASCSKKVRSALPEQYANGANIVGFVQVRDWGDARSKYFQEDFEESILQFVKNYPDKQARDDATIDILALSGGGAKGAFGAGFLKGWYDSGDYPTFKLVTGISTGALIAPFAFLGGEHLDTISTLYTTMTDDDVYKKKPAGRILFSLFGSDAVSSSLPLQNLLEEYVDKEFVEKVAEEYRKGRRLFIGTTNLDAKRLVIWNMGHIANIGDENAVNLFQKIMLASASIPIALPPVYFSVEADGKQYDEMHVDGGATVEVFFYGSILDIDAASEKLNYEKPSEKVKLYIIRNSIIEPKYKTVRPRIIDIATSSLSHLLVSHGIGDLYRIYTISERDGFDFNLASIPEEYNYKPTSAFDNVEMNMLFDLGYEAAVNGYDWKKLPPNYEE